MKALNCYRIVSRRCTRESRTQTDPGPRPQESRADCVMAVNAVDAQTIVEVTTRHDSRDIWWESWPTDWNWSIHAIEALTRDEFNTATTEET